MTKSANPPVKGALHKALSKGCGTWTPVLPPVRKSGPEECGIDTVTDESGLAGSRNDRESADTGAAMAGVRLLGPSSVHMAETQRGDGEDDEAHDEDKDK